MIDTLLTVIDRIIQLKDHRDMRLKELFSELLEPTFDELLVVHRDYMRLFDRTRRMLPELSIVNMKYIKNCVSKRGSYLLFADIQQANIYTSYMGLSKDMIGSMRMEITHWVDVNKSQNCIVGFRSDFEARNYCDDLGIDKMNIRQADILVIPDAEYEMILDAMNFVVQARLDFEPVRIKLGKTSEHISRMTLGKEANKFIQDIVDYYPLGTFSQKLNTDGSMTLHSGATSIVNVFESYLADENRINAHVAKKCISEIDSLLTGFQYVYRNRWAQVCESFAELKISVIGRM